MTTGSLGGVPFAALTTALDGRYRLERELGSGGMATVYLAEDVRHHRKVALKVIHPELSAVLGPERFLKEIELTASLQHPHILPLFDSGSANGQLYYVMPFAAGETLRARLARERQLPVGEAVRIAREAADALDYAHRQGVVHRDIKPENLLLQDGHVVIADFGIALAVEQAGGARMTQTGLSLGTPQYMAPEQAMGERSIDARADVYALGAVLYEMLAGEPPFTGPNAQAIVARVLTERPRPLETLRDTVPPHVADAVHVAMSKLPADRFPTAAAFANALADASSGATRSVASRAGAPNAAAPGTSRWRVGPAMLAASAFAAIAAFGIGWSFGATRNAELARPSPERRVLLPLSSQFDVRGADLTASADGRTLVVREDAGRLVVRRVGSVDLLEIPNVLPASSSPFLSDDGTRIGFINGASIVVEALDGGAVATINGPSATSGAFLGNDRVVATDGEGLLLLRLTGGNREVVVAAPPGASLLQPLVLPGEKHVLLSVVRGDLGDSRIIAVNLASHRVDTLPVGPALRPQYGRGWLYFARPSGQLFAARIDPRTARVRGAPVALGLQAVVARQGRVSYAAGDGLLAVGDRPQNRLVAIGANGRHDVMLEALGTYHNPRVSPDGNRILLDRQDGGPAARDVWILDLPTHTLSRATTVGDAHDAAWTPDGRHITYISFSTGGPLVTSAADGGSTTQPLAVEGAVNPGQWLPDGSAYVAGIVTNANNSDLYAISADGSRRDPIATTRFDEHSPAVSPDGKRLAYVSDETGRRQVYVRPMHGGGRTLVSQDNGEEPVWTRDGRELLYVEHSGDSSRILAARITSDSELRVVSRAVVVPNLRYEPVGNHANWDVMPDGRMVFVEPAAGRHILMVFDPALPAGP